MDRSTCQISDWSDPKLIGQGPVDDNSVLDDETADGKDSQEKHVENEDFLT